MKIFQTHLIIKKLMIIFQTIYYKEMNESLLKPFNNKMNKIYKRNPFNNKMNKNVHF